MAGKNNGLNLDIPIPVSKGGSGTNAFVANAPILGGSSSTSNFQSASTGLSNSGYVLTSTGSSSIPTWQALPGGSGSIVQVVYGSDTTTFSLNAVTLTTVMTATITPTSSSNHILIMGSLSYEATDTTHGSYILPGLYRGVTQIAQFYSGFPGGDGGVTGTSAGTNTVVVGRSTTFYYDAPATTSSTTYTYQCRCSSGSSACSVNANGQLSNIILMEIAL